MKFTFAGEFFPETNEKDVIYYAETIDLLDEDLLEKEEYVRNIVSRK